MTITELLQQLKAHIKERQSAFVITHDWCGDTEAGFHTEHEFDLEKLHEQMDKFGEDLRQRGVPEHLATQPQAPQGGESEFVTRESAEQAIDHMSQYNGAGREVDAREMLIAAPTKTPEVQG